MPDPRQREMLLPIPNKGDVALAAAAHRLWQAAHQHFSGIGTEAYVAVMGAIPQELWDRGAALELQRPGRGLPFVLQQLGTGPPQAAVTG